MQELDINVFKQFIGNIPQFLWWKDTNSIFLGCNENIANFFKLKDPSDIIGMTDFDLFDSEDALSVRKMDQEVMESGKPQLNFEEQLDIPGMGKKWLSTSKIPLYDDDKNIAGTIGWFIDITEIKEVQIKLDDSNQAIIDYSLQLEKTNKKLELANLDLERFAYAASHDLKTPVRTMKAFASLLKKKESDKLSEKSQGYIGFICDSAERMEALIEGILEYAKVGSQNLITENVDLHHIVSEKIIDLKLNPESKKAKIELNLPTTKIKAHKYLVGMVFYNLIHNGIKFNESLQPLVSCDFSEEKEQWIFSVTDNGMGIASGHEETIFEPFKRLVGESIDGSGLGLSTCKKIVALHQGDIWVDKSTKGQTSIMFSISKSL